MLIAWSCMAINMCMTIMKSYRSLSIRSKDFHLEFSIDTNRFAKDGWCARAFYYFAMASGARFLFAAVGRTGPSEMRGMEMPGGFNFPRPDLAVPPASPSPSFRQTYPNLTGGQAQPCNVEQHPQGGNLQFKPGRRPIFDDKIVSSDMMRYADAKKTEWLKTMNNYLILKALEMKHYLPWPEHCRGQTLQKIDLTLKM